MEPSCNPISITGEQLHLISKGQVRIHRTAFIRFLNSCQITELLRCFILCKRNEKNEGRNRDVSYSRNFTHSQRSVITSTLHTSGHISELGRIRKNWTLMLWNQTHKKIAQDMHLFKMLPLICGINAHLLQNSDVPSPTCSPTIKSLVKGVKA